MIGSGTFYDPFENVASFSSIEKTKDAINTLEKQFSCGHGKSGYLLGLIFDPDNVVISSHVKQELGSSHNKAVKYYNEAYKILLDAANNGDPESMYTIALYYQAGLPPVSLDNDLYELWKNKAINAGYQGVGQL